MSFYNHSHLNYSEYYFNHSHFDFDFDFGFNKAEAAGFIFINSVFGLAGVFGNLLVIVAICTNAKLRTKTNCFLFSLAIADFFISAMCVPLWNIFLFVLSGELEYVSVIFYMILFVMDPYFGAASIMNLAAISAVRLYAVLQPFRFDQMPRKGFAIGAFLIPWLFPIAVVLLSTSIAFHEWSAVLIVVVIYFIPLVIMAIFYSIIIKKTLNSARGGQESAVQNHRAVIMMVIVMVCFVITWSPYICTMVTQIHCRTCQQHSIVSYAVVKMLQYSNSMMNPIIYTCRSRDFKEAFVKILSKCFPCFKLGEHVIIQDKQMDDIAVDDTVDDNDDML